jgi:fibronectin-binding autotransporter adhesin
MNAICRLEICPRHQTRNHNHSKPSMKKSACKLFGAALVATFVTLSASAAGGNWTNLTSSIWSATTNWNPNAVPGTAAGDVVSLTNNLGAALAVTLDTPATMGTLNIGDSTTAFFAFTLSPAASQTLTFNNSGSGAKLVQQITTASDVINAPIVLADNLTVTNTSTLTLGGVVSGPGFSVTKIGSGTLTLANSNTFTGGLTVSNGVVNINSNSIAGAGAAGTGTLTLAGGLIQNTSAGGVTISNNITAQAGTTSTIQMNGQDVNIYGNISGSGNLTGAYAGSGTHQIALIGDNSGYTGTFTVNNNSGIRFRFSVASAGSSNAAWVLNNNNTDGQSLNFGNGTIYFGSLSGNGQFRQDNGSATSTLVVGGLNTDVTWAGRILLGSSAHAGVTKVGTGAWTLTGANGYDRTTTVENGTLIAGANGTIPTAIALGDAVSVTNTAALNPRLFNGAAITTTPAITVGTTDALGNVSTAFALGGSTANSSVFSGGISLNQSLVVTQAVGGALTLSGGITNLTANPLTVTFNNVGAITNSIAAIDNGVAGGTVAVIENGPGMLTLAATNTYTGNTTVNNGALVVNGATASGSTVSVTGSGSVLGGAGTVGGSTTISGSGVLTPRAAAGSATTLTFSGNLTLSSASANFTLGTLASGANDQVIYGGNGSGTLTLDNTDTINVTNSGGLDISADYVLFANSGGGTVSMATTPTLKTNGVTVTPGAGKFVITNYPGSPNVVLHFLPLSTAPVVNSQSASPASLGHYQSTTVTVNITPASGKSVTNLSVTVDGLAGAGDPVKLTGPGGNGSGNWTGTFTASGSLVANPYSIGGVVQQNDGSTAGWSVNVTVTNYSDVWSGGGANNQWSTGGNWSVGYAPGTGDAVAMDGTTQTTNNLDSSKSIGSLTFNSGAGSFDITNAASTLTLTGGVINNSSSPQVLDVPVALSGSQTVNAASGNVTLNGAVSGSGAGLTVSGTTVTMAGNNSYTGGTTVSPGSTLILSGDNTAATGATVINGTLQLQSSNAVAGSALTLNNGNTLNLLADADTAFTNSGTTLPAGAGNSYNITANSLNSPSGDGHTLALSSMTASTAPNTSPIYLNISSTSGDTFRLNNGLTLNGTGSGAWGTDELIFSPNGANVILNGLSQVGLNGGILLNSSSTETLTITGNVNWVASRTLFAEVLNGTLILNNSATGAQSGANWGFQAILYSGTLCLNSQNAIIPTSSASHPSLLIDGGTLDNSSAGDVTLSAAPTIGINGDFTFTGTHSLNLGTGSTSLLLGGHTVTVSSNTLTFGGSISDGGSGYSLSMTGNGTLALTASNSYSGGTYVNGGTLALSAALTGTTATGILTVNDGGTLQISAAGDSQLSPSTLTLGSGGGATNSFVAVASTSTAPVHATNLVLNGTTTITVKSGTLQKGFTYPLIAYDTPATGGGSVVLGSLPPLMEGYLTDSGSLISITITNVTSEIWSGAANGTWDTASLDWKTNGVTGTYIDGAPVLFNDTATGTTSITNIPTVVSPFSVTVSNNSKAYSFAGGTIGGSGALTKNGSGTLTLLNTNTFTGGTTITDGTLQLGNGSAGNGAVAGDITDNANLTFANPLDQTFAGIISGTGSLTKTGNGTLTLSGANSFSGPTTVKRGSVSFSAANNLSTNTVVLGDPATGADAALQLTGTINVANNVTVASGAGTRTLRTVGNSTVSGNVALTNNLTAIVTGSGDSHLSGTITGVGNITVSNSTANILWMDGPSSPGWTGSFIIQAGTVRPGTANNQFATNTVLSISSSNSAFLNVGGINADLYFAGVNDIAGATGGGFGGGSSIRNVVLGGSGNYTYSGSFSSAFWGIYVNLSGSGKQTLTGTNAYGGWTTVNSGTLALSAGGTISNSPNFAIGSGATFDVSGLTSTFGLASGQTLRNTSVAGAGNLVGNVNLSAGSLLLNYTNGTPALNVANGTLTFNANPTTVTVAGSVLPGGSYKLIAKGAGGSVAGTLPSTFTINGTGAPTGATLQIDSGELYLVVPSTVAYLTNSISGNTLTFTWPAGQGWTLQSQTNSLSTGLTTTGWGAVAGGIDGSNSVTIDPSKATVFYRLTK